MSDPRSWWLAARRRAEAAFGAGGPAVLAILGLLAALQLDFALRDTRLPRDANAALRHVPDLADALLHGRYGELASGIARTGGWQEGAVTALALLSGRSVHVWHAWFTGWLLLAVAAIARAARAVREDAVVPTVALFAGFPVVLEEARIGWIHLPELALLLVVVAVLLEDEPVEGARAWIVGGALALAGSLRGSGLAWSIALALLALPRAAGRRSALAAVLGGVGVALLVTGREIPAYTTEKVGASVRYASLGGAYGLLLLQLALGRVASWFVAIGVGIGVTAWPRERRGALVAVGALGVAVPLVSVFALSAPVTNTPAFVAAVALLAGVGLASLGPWGARFAALLSLPLLLAQLVPERLTSPFGVPLSWGRYWRDDPQNYQRPFPDAVAPALAEPLASCAAQRHPCSIVTEAGLFTLTPEERGQLELFFLGYAPGDIVLVPPSDVEPLFPVDVVARYRCEGATANWAGRHPGYAAAADALIVSRGLTVERTIPAGPGCSYRWNTSPALEPAAGKTR